MQQRVNYWFIFIMVFSLSPLAWAATDEELEYPAIGILSSDASDHYRAWGKTLLSDNWSTLVDKYNNYCKTSINSIPLNELATLLVFSEADLRSMTVESQKKYDKDSDYFKTCNYIEYYIAVWEVWDDRKNQLLDWGDSDAYIDTEYSLLLVKFLDKADGTSFDQRRVSALFIHKEFQFGSNKQASDGALGWIKYLIVK